MPGKNPKRTIRKYVKKGYNVAKTAYAAYNMATELASLVNVEKKYKDLTATNLPIGWNGAVMNGFLSIAQGQTASLRIGDSIKVTSIHLKIRLQSSLSTGGSLVRVILFWDKENTVSTPSDLFDTLGTVAAPMSNFDKDQKSEIVILRDRTFNLENSSDELVYLNWRFFKKNAQKHVRYEANTTTIEQNRLKCFLIGDQDPAVSPNRYHAEARIHYIDN